MRYDPTTGVHATTQDESPSNAWRAATTPTRAVEAWLTRLRVATYALLLSLEAVAGAEGRTDGGSMWQAIASKASARFEAVRELLGAEPICEAAVADKIRSIRETLSSLSDAYRRFVEATEKAPAATDLLRTIDAAMGVAPGWT